MQDYYGIKRIQAKPMTRLAYNNFRGWALPEDENGEDEGYIVIYPDSESNTMAFTGYVSWSPTKVFDEAYQPTNEMSFSCALQALKDGFKLTRKGWNGKDMFVYLVQGSTFKVNRAPLLGIYPEGTEIIYNPHIDIKNTDGTIATWVASIGDMMATDWAIVN